MDKPTSPAGPDPSKSSWPEDSSSEQGFGATGIFGTVSSPEPAEKPAGSGPEFEPYRAPVAEPPRPQPLPEAKPFAEPVVHKVVFGGGGAESSPELLDRMRMASAERAPVAEKMPGSESGSKGSAGFTQLLRTLGSESSAPPAAAKATPVPVAPPPAQDSGFTSLLRTLGSQEAAATPVENPVNSVPSPARFVPEEPRRASAAPAPGGFTELLRMTPSSGPDPGGKPTPTPGPMEAPVSSAPAGAIPTPSGNSAGTFTQLFGTFGGAGATPSAPTPSNRDGVEPPRASPGSFTRMLSLEQQSAPATPAYREETKPSAGGLDYGLPPAPGRPAETSSDPFSSPPAESQPIQSTPPGAGVGITRLIQMLDEPSRAPAPRMEETPVSPPSAAGPGAWTQTFASLATPEAPAAPAAKAPEWAPPPAPPSTPPYTAPRETQYPASVNQPAANPPAAAPGKSGPSEFTRILDASRLREMAMRGGTGAENAGAPPAQSFGPASAPAAAPQFQAPAPPPPPAMQGFGAMPQPGGFPPPQPPAYPMHFAPPAGAPPAPGGSLPHQPGMFAPPPPMPPAPQAPPLKPVQPPMGKMQQFVPLLLVLVIVLLVALLVTVIFLMKH